MLAIIIESGLVYTASLVVQLILSTMNCGPGTFVIIGIGSQIVVGIVDPFLIDGSLVVSRHSILLRHLFASYRG